MASRRARRGRKVAAIRRHRCGSARCRCGEVPVKIMRRHLCLAACLGLLPVLVQCASDDLAKLIPAETITTTSRDAARAAELISEYRVVARPQPCRRRISQPERSRRATRPGRSSPQAGQLSHGAFARPHGRLQLCRRGAAAENLSAGSGDRRGARSGDGRPRPRHMTRISFSRRRAASGSRAPTVQGLRLHPAIGRLVLAQ